MKLWEEHGLGFGDTCVPIQLCHVLDVYSQARDLTFLFHGDNKTSLLGMLWDKWDHVMG